MTELEEVAEAAPGARSAPVRRTRRNDLRSTNRHVGRGVPILGITGVNGVGKTALAVDIAIDAMKAGRTVYSTVPIDSPWGKSIPITMLDQLLELRDAVVLLDEVGAVFPSDNASSLPPALGLFLQVMRHQELTVIWTAPAWGRAHIKLRQITQAVITVQPLVKGSDTSNPWPMPRVVMAGLLDCVGIKTDAEPDKVMRRRLYRLPKLDAFGCYDTHAETPMIGYHAMSGTAPCCGGSVTRPKHDKARHDLLGISWDEEVHGLGALPPALSLARAQQKIRDEVAAEIARVESDDWVLGQ